MWLDARASKVTAPAAEPRCAWRKVPAPSHGACLLLVSCVAAVWLGHLFPFRQQFSRCRRRTSATGERGGIARLIHSVTVVFLVTW
jgi:hypothetical protein